MAPHALFQPARLGPITLRNRVVKCATFENLARDGLVTDPLVAWHREFTAGGVGTTTLAYSAAPARRNHAFYFATVRREGGRGRVSAISRTGKRDVRQTKRRSH